MLTLGIQKVKECGYPMTEPRCMMCQETYEGSLAGISGYVVYDMYYNA